MTAIHNLREAGGMDVVSVANAGLWLCVVAGPCSGARGRAVCFGACQHSAQPHVHVISTDRQHSHHGHSHRLHVRRQRPLTCTGKSLPVLSTGKSTKDR